MSRRLINFCLAWVIVLGCWGGVLAAALCPHQGCETSAAVADHTTTHGEHSSDENHVPAAPAGNSAHGEDHHGQAAEPPARERTETLPSESAGITSGSHEPSCSHCVGRREMPPSSTLEWQSDSVRKAVKELAAHAALKFAAPAVPHVRQIAPAQHAPPGASDRQLLLSVFRI